jgi:nucleotidyltransferase substrate binding protein (TIGR01987 family)
LLLLCKLEKVAKTKAAFDLSHLEQEGLIQIFEYTYELAWKTLQDFLRLKGYVDIAGPNPVIHQAFQDGYITDGNAWKKMKTARELSSHTYDESTADEIAGNILDTYYFSLLALKNRLESEASASKQ